MTNTDPLIDRIDRFLKQQREVYGDFSVNENKKAVYDIEKVKDPVNDATGPVTLEEVQSLKELRELCLEADVLKTDLEGTNLVFGVGNEQADLMVIGEAPGEQEDKKGEPFVGPAGQLLDKIMEAINFSRNEIYIANILKHRPPGNRNPNAEERARSLPFLLKQIELINPKIILCVGKVAATTLLDTEETLSNMRQKVHDFRGIPMIVTYHPAILLRNQQWKRPTWDDVQLLRKEYDRLAE